MGGMTTQGGGWSPQGMMNGAQGSGSKGFQARNGQGTDSGQPSMPGAPPSSIPREGGAPMMRPQAQQQMNYLNGGYRSPAAGLGAASLMLGAPNNAPIPIAPRAQLTPDMLAPKVAARTEPDKVLDPAWYDAEQKAKDPSYGTTSGIYNYKDGGGVGEILERYGYAHGGVTANPTEAQKKAGNYRKGHIRFHGLDVTIETAKGQTRRGTGHDGKKWAVDMPADYGYVKGTVGKDGDHVDVFVGPHAESTTVFLINQQDHRTGKFDEHKAMLGYKSEKEACEAYCKAFNDGNGHKRMKSLEVVSIDAFKKWLKSGKTKSLARGKDIVDHALKCVVGRGSRG